MRGAICLSFDIEEHHRIEAAVGIDCPPELKRTYADRMEASTERILELLARAGNVPATFFIVGEIAESHPKLVRRIAEAGHEIGSHSHDHRRIHRFQPDAFRDDLRRSLDALQQTAGVPVVGFRAPTFSLMAETSWATDVFLDLGLRYDTSIFPVRHDRYGVPDAPSGPFWLKGEQGKILELPPLTLRRFGQNLPVAGGGYFRLFPLGFMKRGVGDRTERERDLSMLYFHPWEFDPGQPKLPLKRLSKWRTYVGVGRSAKRLHHLLDRYRGRFVRAIDAVNELEKCGSELPSYDWRTEARR